ACSRTPCLHIAVLLRMCTLECLSEAADQPATRYWWLHAPSGAMDNLDALLPARYHLAMASRCAPSSRPVEKSARRTVDGRDAPPRARRHATADWTSRFVDALREATLVSDACRRAGVSRSGAYKRRTTDPTFAQAWAEAQDEAIERLEAEAFRR